MSEPCTCGTFFINASMIWVDISSGRSVVSDPLLALPIGLRAVATMTASGMVIPLVELWCRDLAGIWDLGYGWKLTGVDDAERLGRGAVR